MKSMFKIALASLVAAVSINSANAAGSHLGQTIDPNLVVTVGNLDWVYASPCAGAGNSCGTVVLSNGFNFATDAQWNASFSSISQLIAAFGTTHCAASYFSNYGDNCDYSDLNVGAIWHSPLANVNYIDHPAAETFLVRVNASNDVPEPASLALFGLGILGLGAIRRSKKSA